MTDPRVLLVASSLADGHDPAPGHPERPERLRAVLDGAESAGLRTGLTVIEPRAATLEELAAVHAPGYLDALERLCREGGGWLDGDTAAGPGSWAAATVAAGAGLELCTAATVAALAGLDHRPEPMTGGGERGIAVVADAVRASEASLG